jgi:23S rRNA (uridine2552-2'-O)-methyltransferase
LTKKWLREQKGEYYYRKAVVQGYRTRAAYKLLQASEKYHFIKEGNIVVDVGAAPGGWMQVARKLVGEKGHVLGIDLKPIKNLNFSNVKTIVTDVEKLEGEDILRELPRMADVFLSDIAPNVSGIWDLDHARQIYLSEISLKLATYVLRVGGSLYVKVFQGSYFKEFIDRVKLFFRDVRVIKPLASRKKSAEIYIIAMGFNGKRS